MPTWPDPHFSATHHPACWDYPPQCYLLYYTIDLVSRLQVVEAALEEVG